MAKDILDEFVVNGKKITLRHINNTDLIRIWKYFNEAVSENVKAGGRLGINKKVSLDSQKKWLSVLLKAMKSKNAIHIVAEHKNEIIGNAEVMIKERDADRHVGDFGIIILEKFTGFGLGTKLSNIVIDLAQKKLKIEIVKLNVYSTNKRAQGLYRKLGFKKIGVIKNGIKIKNRYLDNILMVKYLE